MIPLTWLRIVDSYTTSFAAISRLLSPFWGASGRYPSSFVVVREICGIGMSGGTATTLRP